MDWGQNEETVKNIAQSSKHKNDDELCLTEYKYSMMILIEIESVFVMRACVIKRV